MAWDNAANIINDAAVELGLISTDIPEPWESTDANIVQLCRLLKSVGQDLLRDYAWTHLQKTYAFETTGGIEAYDLPDDFARVLDQTQWNRTQQMPLLGPVAAQGWQYLKAVNTVGAGYRLFRIVGDQFLLNPIPTGEDQVAYEYVSRYWVRHLDDVEPTDEALLDGEDTLYFDRRLLVCGVKLAFQRAKGFDATAAKADFDEALARARGADGAAPVLSLNGRGALGERFVGPRNLPDTGFGS